MRCFALDHNGKRCSRNVENKFPPLCSSHRGEIPMSFTERKMYREQEVKNSNDLDAKGLAKQATEQALAEAEVGLGLNQRAPVSDIIQECRIVLGFNTYFTVLKTLGTGTFGKVFSARVTPKGKTLNYAMPDIVAVKEMSFNPEARLHLELLKNELRILKEINVPHSVKYYGCYIESDKIYIIMELVNGEELLNVLHKVKLTQREKLILCQNIAQGINEIHRLNIAHRDLKFQNIMVDINTFKIKLIDFGLACNLAEMSFGCNVPSGSPAFMDPHVELLDIKSMKLADWWAFGQMLVIMFTYNFLYTPEGYYRSITAAELNKFPAALRDIIVKLTDPKIKQNARPRSDEIIASLNKK